MSANVKGHWFVGPVDDTLISERGADGQIYQVAQVLGDYDNAEEWPLMEANARLIAAAPELLQALILALEELERYEEDLTGERYNNTVINAAIAKAVQS